ncbi:hypothetical protein JXA32_14080 [Candidatus Sumerlaeota bacterium]|nr:hypothetical protein [Candidatus Sumerlaeota bacterium]
MNQKTLPIRGYLLHITHYDPVWNANKDKEEPFNLKLGLELIDAMAEAGLNLLLIDPKDGVRYASHPELARPYTQDMDVLAQLTDRAAQHEIETAIKLNFSQSAYHQHNHWFRPHKKLFDRPAYWEHAFKIIDELIAVVKPARFFHIGMDEDHDRSYRQYVKAIKTLRDGLVTRHLRTLFWNDSACHWPETAIHRDKALEAERHLPKDVIHVLWDYGNDDLDALSRIREEGFEPWGAPGGNPELVAGMRDRLLEVGGAGILLTHWIPCIPSRRQELLDRIQTCGPVCSGHNV